MEKPRFGHFLVCHEVAEKGSATHDDFCKYMIEEGKPHLPPVDDGAEARAAVPLSKEPLSDLAVIIVLTLQQSDEIAAYILSLRSPWLGCQRRAHRWDSSSKIRFAPDSPLEEAGFEPSVPA
jgi:hypothetical protein